MYYSIRETLEPVAEPVIGQDDAQYVALLSHSAWRAQKEQFDLGFDIEEPENAEIFTTHAQVNSEPEGFQCGRRKVLLRAGREGHHLH